MSIPYRTQQSIKRIAIILLVLLVVGILLWGMWFVWLQRFVIYSRSEGAVLDFSLSEELTPGEEALPPENENPVEIYYNEGDDKIDVEKELTKLKGYYFDRTQITGDPAAVWEKIRTLPADTAVLMDLKDAKGKFYYSTKTGRPVSQSADVAGVDQLLANLKNSNCYLIARVPALRDFEFGLAQPSNGLPVAEGYLWADADYCYWLNPTKQGTISYLIDIAEELRDLGFDEVVFEEYCFPDTEQIVFKADKAESLTTTAQTLVTACATEQFTVSFVSDGSWTPPTGRTRIYLQDVGNPMMIADAVEAIGMEDPAAQTVFLTTNTDVRFDEYCVLRPIEMAM